MFSKTRTAQIYMVGLMKTRFSSGYSISYGFIKLNYTPSLSQHIYVTQQYPCRLKNVFATVALVTGLEFIKMLRCHHTLLNNNARKGTRPGGCCKVHQQNPGLHTCARPMMDSHISGIRPEVRNFDDFSASPVLPGSVYLSLYV